MEATVLKYVDIYTFKRQAVFNRPSTLCVCVCGLASNIAYLNVITALSVNSCYITAREVTPYAASCCTVPRDKTDMRGKGKRKKRKQPPALLPRGIRTLGLTLRHNSSQLELNYIGDFGLPNIINTLTTIPSDTEIYILANKKESLSEAIYASQTECLFSTTCYSESSGKHIQIKREKNKDSATSHLITALLWCNLKSETQPYTKARPASLSQNVTYSTLHPLPPFTS